jgi:hypothetical protein
VNEHQTILDRFELESVSEEGSPEELEAAVPAHVRREIRSVPSRAFYLPGDRGDPPRRLGRIQPRRFSPLTAVKIFPQMIREFWTEHVPDEFWTLDGDSAGKLVVVACPCGEQPTIPMFYFGNCGCGRWYWPLEDCVLLGNAIEEPEEEEDGHEHRVN